LKKVVCEPQLSIVCVLKNMHYVTPSFRFYVSQEFTVHANPFCTMCVKPFLLWKPILYYKQGLKETTCKPYPKISSRIIVIDCVTVTSRSCDHMLLTYSLSTLACKWSSFSIWLYVHLWILMMMLMDYDVMLWDIYVLTDAIDEFPLSVPDTWQIEDVDGINGPPWTLDRVREWIIVFWVFYLCICDIWLGILWCCLWIIDIVSLMDVGWRLISNQTHIRSKGTMHTTTKYWGSGVAAPLSQPTSTLTMAWIVG